MKVFVESGWKKDIPHMTLSLMGRRLFITEENLRLRGLNTVINSHSRYRLEDVRMLCESLHDRSEKLNFKSWEVPELNLTEKELGLLRDYDSYIGGIK